MCDTKGHEHWCSGCGKNLNKEPEDSYIEIEWSQNESGQFVQDKKMICNVCLEEMPNVKELNEFFSKLQYQPWGHVFCSSCKKDITAEYEKEHNKGILSKLKPEKPTTGVDYECLEFKEHKDKKHFIKVVVLCQDCKKGKFNLEHIEELKKLGRNPIFKPTVTCPSTEKCGQFKKGDENVNCRHIVIGRDRESLNMALLCGRKHKGALPMPFDDGLAILRPRKKKGGAMVSPVSVSPVTPAFNPVDSIKEMEKVFDVLFKKYGIGPHAKDNGKLAFLEARLDNIEKALGIKPPAVVTVPVETQKVEAVKEVCP